MFFSLRLFLLCFLKVEKAQLRPGRRKPPPVIFASLGLSATWTQRMFGEFEQRDKPPVGLSERRSATDNVWLKGETLEKANLRFIEFKKNKN